MLPVEIQNKRCLHQRKRKGEVAPSGHKELWEEGEGRKQEVSIIISKVTRRLATAAKKSCSTVCFKDERTKEDPLSTEIQYFTYLFLCSYILKDSFE